MGDHDKPAAGGRSLPEDIASGAGLPRSGEAGHSLHPAGRPAGQDPDEALRAATAASLGRLNEAGGSTEARAESAAHRTGAAASDLRARSGEAAGSAQDRASGALNETGERVSGALNEARERATDAYDDVRGWAADRYDEHRGRASDLVDHGTRRFQEGRTATEQFVSENPLLVGVVGLAAGLLLGALLPRTRQEDRALGPYADEVRDQGLRYARDITDRGRAFVETALDPENLDTAMKRATAPAGQEDRDGAKPGDKGTGNTGTGGTDAGHQGPERKAHTL